MATKIFYPVGITDTEKQAISGGGGGGGLTPVVATSTPITATAGNLYVVDAATIASAVVANLPALPTDGDQIGFCDGSGNDENSPTGFGQYNLTINPDAAHTIQGDASRTLTRENEGLWLTFSSSLNRWTEVSDANAAATGGGGGGSAGTSFDGRNGTYLLFAHNNGVNYVHPTNNVQNDIDFSTTDVDVDGAYNSGTGEYTFARDAVVLIKGQIRNTTGQQQQNQIRIMLDTGGGFNEYARGASYIGGSSLESTHTVNRVLNASSGDVIKLTSEAELSSVNYSGDKESSFFEITEIGSGGNTGNLGRILLTANNNGVDFNNNTSPNPDVLNFSTASIDPESGYSSGEYTFASDAVVRLQGQITSNDAQNTGDKRIIIQVDTGSGYNDYVRATEFQGDSTLDDHVRVHRSFAASAGDKVRVQTYQNDNNPWVFSGTVSRSYFDIIELGGAAENNSRILLNANNNGVGIIHAVAGVEQDITYSTATVDPDLGYDSVTGIYTFKQSGLHLITGQITVDPNEGQDGARRITLELDTGSGFNPVAIYEHRHSSAQLEYTFAVHKELDVNPGDRIKLVLWCEQANVDFLGSDEHSFFEVTKLGGFAPGTQRTVLTQNTCYYIDPAGDDTADGLTPGTAWKDVQLTLDKLATFDIGIYNLTVQFANGTYVASKELFTKPTLSNGGAVILQGDPANTSNVIIQGSSTADNSFNFAHGSNVFIVRDLTIEHNRVDGRIVRAISASNSRLINVRINATTVAVNPFAYIDSRDASIVQASNIEFDSDAALSPAHLIATISAGQVLGLFTTYDVSGSFTMGTGTTSTRLNGLLDFLGSTWNVSGSLSGTAIFGQSGITRLPIAGDLTTIPPFDGSNNLTSGAVTI